MNDSPIVAFLIPFPSRAIKSKWEIACAHLHQPLKSIQNSSNGNYCVVVADHEAPDFDIRFDSQFYFLPVNHPIPLHENHAVALKLDKLANIATGWSYAKPTWNPSCVMKLDADDLIGSKLVEWLENARGDGGYLLKRGWLWRSGSRYLFQYRGRLAAFD